MSKQFVRITMGKTRKGDAARLAAQLAPLEEQTSQRQDLKGQSVRDGGPNREPGAIIVDSNNLVLPKDIAEGSLGKRFFGIEPVVLVILTIMLAFIAFIAWQISRMPAQ